MRDAGRWIDVSVPVLDRMVTWPGDPDVVVEQVSSLDRGDVANVTRISLGAHTGTHVDAPVHFLTGAPAIDAMPHDAMFGRAHLLAVDGDRAIEPADLERHAIGEGDRVLLRTRNSERPWYRERFRPDYVHLSPAGAAWLAARRIRCVGIDYLSIGGFDERENVATHLALLSAGVWIIEGLFLSGLEPGAYDLACLPLRIEGADGAPARVMVRRCA